MRIFAPLTVTATATAIALTLSASAVPAFDLSAMTEGERDAFGSAVRDYLMENPEVIMEAVNQLEAREAAAQEAADVGLVETHAEALFDDGFSWVGGNPDGDVTVVEFIDYRCGFCRRAHPEVEELVASDGNIRLVVKEFPILGEDSVTSSRFAMAARMVAGDEAYKAVHDALIALNGAPTPAALMRLADTLGLEGEAILAAMDSDEINDQLVATRALAQDLRISGTPTFVMGGQMVRGYVPLEGMREIIAEERQDG